MEYAKDIILKYDGGQENGSEWRRERYERKCRKKNKVITNILDKLFGHKMVVTVISVTVFFMILDMFLINSFINLLTEI